MFVVFDKIKTNSNIYDFDNKKDRDVQELWEEGEESE